MNINLRKIAKISGVSVATVSRVINDKDGVSETTRARILKILEENMYVQNIGARNLKTAKSKTIGFLISKFSDPFFILVFEGMQKICRKRGYHVLILDTNEDIEQEREAIKLMLGYRVEGIVASFVNPNIKILDQLSSLNINVLMLDRKIERFKADSVTLDNIGGSREQINYLSKLGHKDIAVVHGPTSNSTGKERLNGYFSAMKEHGLNVNDNYVTCGEFNENMAYHSTIRLMSLEKRPTAVAVHNNMMCLGAFKALMDLKINIPHEVSLIGFDDFDVVLNSLHDLGAYLGPGITLMETPVLEMGIVAAEMLLDRIEGKMSGDVKYVVFPAKLIIRNSCIGVEK